MRILTKPDLDNAILLEELIIIMENFGIKDTVKLQRPLTGQSEKRKSSQGMNPLIDLQSMDEKSIKIIAKLMLAMMELNLSLHEFFDGVIYE